MAKLENQARLVNALRAFTGKMPACYASEKEFFLVSLQDLAEYLGELQQETLKETCDSFARKLDAGKVTPYVIDDFKAALDRLISNADFKAVCAGMAGSGEFLKQRLAGLKPVSLLGEAKKNTGRDQEAERLINSAYSRLNFPELVKQVEVVPNDYAANLALTKARAEVADYCGMYRVQLREADTLTPFSMSCVDAALAASYRLFKNISRASGREM
ncbi:MAG TPA: hypothetical protein DCZ93_05170 [Elusimicrobia bacterium]|nr:MAG: hypothetical protein A2X35_07385 [Elusimicrobia bacterium GWA2_61_42]OGR75035.1 MAG: hypothetical protein A2X38_01535 [Elusimicrobia bacterium GWC2_61_25]HBB66683.1 hypothetical protein [Elusimicrobiota bacterium]